MIRASEDRPNCIHLPVFENVHVWTGGKDEADPQMFLSFLWEHTILDISSTNAASLATQVHRWHTKALSFL